CVRDGRGTTEEALDIHSLPPCRSSPLPGGRLLFGRLFLRHLLFGGCLFGRLLFAGLFLCGLLPGLLYFFPGLLLFLLFGFLFREFQLPVVAPGLPLLSATADTTLSTGANGLRCLYEATLSLHNILAVIGNAFHPNVAPGIIGIAAECVGGRQGLNHSLAVDVENVPVLAIVVLNVLPNGAPALVLNNARSLGDKDFCKQTLTRIG